MPGSSSWSAEGKGPLRLSVHLAVGAVDARGVDGVLQRQALDAVPVQHLDLARDEARRVGRHQEGGEPAVLLLGLGLALTVAPLAPCAAGRL